MLYDTTFNRIQTYFVEFCRHSLRHMAATNMHQLTGDFCTVGEVFGHACRYRRIAELSMNFETGTARYVGVWLEHKKEAEPQFRQHKAGNRMAPALRCIAVLHSITPRKQSTCHCLLMYQ